MHLTCTNMPEEKLESALHEVRTGGGGWGGGLGVEGWGGLADGLGLLGRRGWWAGFVGSAGWIPMRKAKQQKGGGVQRRVGDVYEQGMGPWPGLFGRWWRCGSAAQLRPWVCGFRRGRQEGIEW